VFVGNFILEDLVMLFKFYQMWDCKSWYLPLEISDLHGFKNLLAKNKLEKKNSSTFEFDDDSEENNNNNNNNNIRNIYPEPHGVGEMRKFHNYVDERAEKTIYKRRTSPERIFKDKIVDSINNNNNFPASKSSFSFSFPTIKDNSNNISPLFFKEIRNIKDEHGTPTYNMNAPPYKPKITKTGTVIVEEEENLYTESEEESQENKIAVPSQPSENSSNLSLAGTTVGVISSLISNSKQASLQQPFEFIDSNNKTI
jgi:hypothetical protein